MTVEEKRAILGLLDVRVHVESYDLLRVRIEGFVKYGLSLDAAREPAQVGTRSGPPGTRTLPAGLKGLALWRCAN
jgi:hypothetical protein